MYLYLYLYLYIYIYVSIFMYLLFIYAIVYLWIFPTYLTTCPHISIFLLLSSVCAGTTLTKQKRNKKKTAIT